MECHISKILSGLAISRFPVQSLLTTQAHELFPKNWPLEKMHDSFVPNL